MHMYQTSPNRTHHRRSLHAKYTLPPFTRVTHRHRIAICITQNTGSPDKKSGRHPSAIVTRISPSQAAAHVAPRVASARYATTPRPPITRPPSDRDRGDVAGAIVRAALPSARTSHAQRAMTQVPLCARRAPTRRARRGTKSAHASGYVLLCVRCARTRFAQRW